MIRLFKGDAPAELDADRIAALTEEFLKTGDSVWNIASIRDALLLISNSKCAYCEVKLVEESKYLEVDHFRCKKDFPNQVVEWTNLIPSCKRCNGYKSSHNIDVDGMLIDPFSDEPRNHIYMKNYRLRWRDEVGRNTTETLYLNQSDRLVAVRMMVGESVISSLGHIRDRLESYLSGQRSTRSRNAVIRGIEALLRQAAPEAEYSATTATVLLDDPDYAWIRDQLVELDLWGSLSDLEEQAARRALAI